MDDERQQDTDARIRLAFDADPAAAARVARRALARKPRVQQGRRFACGLGASALCAAAVLALWLSPGAPEPESEVEFLNASSVDGVWVLPLPDGSAAITSSEARDDRPPDGCGIVLVEGESR